MTRVFLSYAQEDEVVAGELVAWLQGRGVELHWWQNPDQQGRRFVGDIERGIVEADVFVALLSPPFLASAWCVHERDLALQHEIDLGGGRRFIHVVEVAETPYPESGLLRNYGWLSARSPLTAEHTAALAAALPLGLSSNLHEAPPAPRFQNREDELSLLVNAIMTTGGRDLWAVVSPPRMGKSWLLARVQRELQQRDPRWSVRLVDLREQPAVLRTDAARLLCALLDVDGDDLPAAGPLPDRDLRQFAAEVIRRRRPQLYLLDSADLLDPVAAPHIRAALTAVHGYVQRSVRREARLALVVGTRRYGEWRGLGADPRAGRRFERLPLTEFRVDTVHRALVELERSFRDDRAWECAQRLHRLSGGLPALLIRSLQWADRNEFVTIDEADGDEAFDEVARPYIHDDLLAQESLLPTGDARPGRALEALGHGLRVLAVYRFFTQSHLRFHLETDEALATALAEARWSGTELWDALGRTSLCDQPVDELWQVIEPSIRRLLHRYYHRADAERISAHTDARRFYERWTAVHRAGREQQVVLVECLWHETTRMVLDRPSDVPHLLPTAVSEIARRFAGSPIYEPEEFSTFVVNRLRGDDEFQALLQSYDGLFEEIVKSVVNGIGGTG